MKSGFSLLLPDVWKQPSGVSFVPSAEHFYLNEYTEEQWIVLASQGAVFLPAAGHREGTSVTLVQLYGSYWASTVNADHSHVLVIQPDLAEMGNHAAFFGYSVRLVKDI